MALKLIGRTGHVAGRDVRLSDLLRIGAAEDNDFRLVLHGVSRHHARVVRTGEAYFLEDAGSTNGTFLNGQRVVRERLTHLDVVTIGRDIDLIVVSSSGADSAVTVKAVTDASLEPLDSPGAALIDLPLGEVTLGRLAPSNVLIESAVVSHLHAKVQRTPDHVIVQDLDSANGTYVNGTRARGPVVLKNGDTLAIAGVRKYRVHVTGDSSAKPQEVVVSTTVGFGQGWQTKLVWSAEELAMLEEERRKMVDAARAVRQPAGAAPPSAKPAPPRAPAAAKAPTASPAPDAAKAQAPSPPPPAAKVQAPVRAPATATPAAVKPPAAAAPPAPAPRVQEPPMGDPPSKEPPRVEPPKVEPPKVEPPKPEPPKPPDPPKPPPTSSAAPGPVVPPEGKRSGVRRPPQEATVVGLDVSDALATVLGSAAVRSVRVSGPPGTFVLEHGRHVVGRNEGIGVPIIDLQVSRSHAVIAVTPQGVTVEDTKSANGTTVNGTRIDKVTTLAHGDKVAFGKIEFTVELIS